MQERRRHGQKQSPHKSRRPGSKKPPAHGRRPDDGRRDDRRPDTRRPGDRRPDDRRPPPRPQHSPQMDDVPLSQETHQGVLEMHSKGYGFLRDPKKNYVPQPNDPYVPGPLISKYKLREGLMVAGKLQRGQGGQGVRLGSVETVEGMPPEKVPQRNFDELTAIDPNEPIRLETGREPLTTRIMDLLTPIGKGQRGLIVAAPRTGKTILLQHIAQAVTKNHPEMHQLMLLVDERPEEVTEMRRTVAGEIIASSSDRDASSHMRVAQLVVERARRLTEMGKPVFLLLDSLTRLARAFNKNSSSGGRTMSGGIDVRAMDIPKKLFGTARAFEEGGSLTVLGTALIETGSRMDDVIFQEFKGTGNMELVLDRRLSDRRVFPAMDLQQSGTRKEERLLAPEVYKQVTLLRKSLTQLHPVQAMEALVKKLSDYPSNKEFLARVNVFVK